jgi:hypothetical protein
MRTSHDTVLLTPNKKNPALSFRIASPRRLLIYRSPSPGPPPDHGRVSVRAAGNDQPQAACRDPEDPGPLVIQTGAEHAGCGQTEHGRIRMRRIPDVTRATLHGFISDVIEPGSVVRTDGYNSYEKLDGYRHQPVSVRGSGQEVHAMLPRVHRVISLLKRWLLGTHQGGVSHEQLDCGR